MLKELKSSSQGSTNNFESNSAPSNSLSNVVNSKNIKPLCIVTKNNVNKENVGDGGCVGAVDGTSRAHIDKINLFNVNDNKIRPINVVINWNANGIYTRINELEEFLSRYRVDVCLISESRLSHKSKVVKFVNYNCYRKDRAAANNGGGVMVLVNKKFNSIEKCR
ncbi:hypothetical protein PV325_008592 [Microctonus aethiopoides]|nr:hypothetical protein PV325_008592 [Microctonus aethiopoides]